MIFEMVGAIINSVGILAGGLCGWLVKKPISAQQQSVIKVLLGAATVWFGLKLTWLSLNGTAGQILKQLGIALLAMALGKIVGKNFRLQKFSNRIGQFATKKMAAVQAGAKSKFDDGFLVCTALFCAGPLAILASVQEGLKEFSPVFVIKAVMDALATMAFFPIFGWGVLVSAIPVLAFQDAIIFLLQRWEPMLRNQPWPLLDSILAVDGLLIFCVALIILQLKKIEIANYLPSLAFAPLLTWLLR